MKKVVLKDRDGVVLFSHEATGAFASSVETAIAEYLKEEPDPVNRVDKLMQINSVETIKN